MLHFLDFEKPIAELEGKIEELRRMSEPDGINIADEIHGSPWSLTSSSEPHTAA